MFNFFRKQKAQPVKWESAKVVTKYSQQEQIKECLLEGNSITAMEALDLFGCFRLASRISDLKKQGLNIESRKVQKGEKWVSEYRLNQL